MQVSHTVLSIPDALGRVKEKDSVVNPQIYHPASRIGQVTMSLNAKVPSFIDWINHYARVKSILFMTAHRH